MSLARLLGCLGWFACGVALQGLLEQSGSLARRELGGERVELGGLRREQRPDIVRETDVERGEVAVDEEPVLGLVL
jgi:hypothetical protein